MIGSLKGTIISKDAGIVLVEIQGIGYEVTLTKRHAKDVVIGSTASFFTHHYIREDAVELYGFREREDLSVFRMLISVSGIGPKSALGVLESADAYEIKQAIASEDPKILTRVSGIGNKLAGRIILELKNKLVTSVDVGELSSDLDVIEGLVSLGYKRNVAKEALNGVPSEIKEPAERLRAALKSLGKK